MRRYIATRNENRDVSTVFDVGVYAQCSFYTQIGNSEFLSNFKRWFERVQLKLFRSCDKEIGISAEPIQINWRENVAFDSNGFILLETRD